MTAEQTGNRNRILQDFENEELISLKERRLPKSIRAYIRRLKAEGHWDQAMNIAQAAREQKRVPRQQLAEKELNRSIAVILQTDNQQTQAEQEIRAIWLLYATGFMDSPKKVEELLATLDSKSPDLRAFLEERMVDIRTELRPLLPNQEEIKLMQRTKP